MQKDVMDDIVSGPRMPFRSARRSSRRRRPAARPDKGKLLPIGLAAVAIVSLLAFGSSARALDLTGGPADAPPGGGGCTASGSLAGADGLTLSCTVTTPGNFVDLYFGLANDGSANGAAMDGSGPSGFEIFRYSSSTPSSIIYTSTTTVDDVLSSTEDVNTRLVLTLTSGTGTVVDTGGTPASNDSGDIQKLFRIAGSSFSVHIDVDANTSAIPIFGPSNTDVYDPTHTPASGAGSSITSVDFQFYYNECTP
jgi:hypothetical protein